MKKLKVEVFDKHFSNGVVSIDISIFKWLKLKLFGVCYLKYAFKQGWTGELPFYIVKCPSCKNYFLDYLHGYKGYFICSKCGVF